ncbi:MAG: hypothetical protein HY319_21080 [Armatimonadetes bacterium]|nr:hypothetical protein [Armatimonadota bacterium]
MIELEELGKSFNDLPVPDELVQLIAFEGQLGTGVYYSEGFELRVDQDKSGLSTWSEDPGFLSGLMSSPRLTAPARSIFSGSATTRPPT